MIKWCEEVLKEELLEYNLQMENICNLDRYDNYISEKVLSILLK